VDIFQPATEDLDLTTVLQALGDPVRLKIVRMLAADGEQVCGAIDLGISKSTRSHHFKTLREAGVTLTRVEGTHRHVSLRRDDLQARFPGLLDAVLLRQPAPARPERQAVAGFCSVWRTMRQLVLTGSRKFGGSRTFRRSSYQ
jgi:DNA-binding transcriptional ArsR family regulator